MDSATIAALVVLAFCIIVGGIIMYFDWRRDENSSKKQKASKTKSKDKNEISWLTIGMAVTVCVVIPVYLIVSLVGDVSVSILYALLFFFFVVIVFLFISFLQADKKLKNLDSTRKTSIGHQQELDELRRMYQEAAQEKQKKWQEAFEAQQEVEILLRQDIRELEEKIEFLEEEREYLLKIINGLTDDEINNTSKSFYNPQILEDYLKAVKRIYKQ